LAKRKKKNDLGSGLRALLRDIEVPKPKKKLLNSITTIPVEQIATNPFQPRSYFDAEKLQELAESIKLHGIIQPLTVRVIDEDSYQLIAGERRLQAATLAGLSEVPAYIRSADDQAMLELALIENIQREDLNPIEVALSYQRLIDECQLIHEEVGKRLGKSRATITQFLGLLQLPPVIQKALQQKQIRMGHGRALAGKPIELQLTVFKAITEKHLSVRQTLALVKRLQESNANKSKKKRSLPLAYQRVQDQLARSFETAVELKRNARGRGQIVISFASDEDFNRILEKFEYD
jgi:ParB family chromosome partitioning protein